MSEKKLKIVRGAGVNTKSFTECPYGTGNKVYSYNCQQCKDYVRRVGSGTDFSVECNYGEENRQQLKLSLIGLDEDECKEVLKVAECLIGSVGFVNIVACGHEPVSGELKAVFCGRFFTEIGNSGFTKITLPLSALKVDPWMCGKYNICVEGVENSSWADVSEMIKLSYLIGKEYSLDLSNLPKGVTLC